MKVKKTSGHKFGLISDSGSLAGGHLYIFSFLSLFFFYSLR